MSDASVWIDTLLPFEFTTLSPSSAVLPRNSDRYLQVVERPSGTVPFNATSRAAAPIATRQVTISGVDIDLGPSGNTSVYQRLHNNSDIRELEICCDHLRIVGDLNLPGTNVTIWARRMTFIGNGTIKTTPLAPEGISPDDAGMDGQDAGHVRLYVRDLDMPGDTLRFDLRGAAGQAARHGQKGDAGTSVTPWNGKIDSTPTLWGGQETLNWSAELKADETKTYEPVIVHWDQIVFISGSAYYSGPTGWIKNWNDPRVIGETWPTDGNPPKIMPGQPGLGGAGGNIYSRRESVLTDKRRKLSVGAAGTTAPDLEAADAGTPIHSSKLHVGYRSHHPFPHFKAGVDGNGILNAKDPEHFKILEKRQTKPYPAAPAPGPRSDPSNRDGQLLPLDRTEPWFWMHPLAVTAVAAFARDAFRVGMPMTPRGLIGEYIDALQTTDGDMDIDLALLRGQLMDLAQRIDGPNDFFGHPMGWVPGLSFQTNMKAYERQIESAVARLYLSYWMEHNQAEKSARIASADMAIRKLQVEVKQAVIDQAHAIDALDDLRSDEGILRGKITQFLTDLKVLEGELTRAAKERAEVEHAFRIAGRIIGGVAQVIPVGQPVLGAVGKGFSALADWEGEGPLDAITTVGAAVWDSKLVEDVILPKVKSTAQNLLEAAGVTSAPDPDDEDAALDKAEDDPFDKELEKQQLSSKVKKHIKEQSDAKDQVLSALGSLSVSEQEVDAAVKKAIANCPEFAELEERITILNAEKSDYAIRIAATLAKVDAATTVLATARLTQIALQHAQSDAAALMSPEGLRYTRAMRDRALEQLQRYQYYFAASYVYQFMHNVTGFDGHSEFMFDALRDALRTRKTDVLTAQDFQSLKVVFQQNLITVADQILTSHNETQPGRDKSKGVTTQITLELSDVQLATLHRTGRVDIDPMAMGKLHLSLENVRIYDLVIKNISLTERPERRVDVRVRVHHDGVSHLRSAHNQFIFRGAPTMWGATINTAEGAKPVQEEPTREDLSLILSLVDQADAGQLFARPAAWASLGVEVTVLDMVSDYRPKIDALTLELQYTSHESATQERALFVSTPDGVHPEIVLSEPDISLRQNGQGDFLRIFRENTAVTLTAPETFGSHVFVGWRTRFHEGDFQPTQPAMLVQPGTPGYQGDPRDLITGTSITLTMNESKFLRAVYVLPAS